MSDEIRVRFVIPKEYFEEESKTESEEAIQFDAPEAYEPDEKSPLMDSQFVEVLIVTVAATIASLAKRAAEHWFKKRENGLIVDARHDPPHISFVGNIPRGTMVLIDKDGKASVQRPPSDKKKEILKFVADVLSKLPGKIL